ncbi:MAG: DUF2063 domain-containing protein [Methylocystis sp.]|nr:MAG: DUF2063 domain-containing protein [Methylocystis sp.]
MKLSDFQSLFQARILAGPGQDDAPLIAALRESQRGAAREELLAVYQSGYRARLESFLYEDHPGLRAIMGDEAFEELVREYVETCPPRNPNARWYTTGFPDFLRDHPQWRGAKDALSMAVFERAIVDAFDAPDAAPLSIQALADFSPEESPRLTFTFHPSLVLLELSAGTFAAYEAAGQEETEEENAAEEAGAASPSLAAGGTEAIVVWRCNDESAFRELDPDEHVALSEAKAGRAFGDICQMAAFQQSGDIEPERLAQFLASWFGDGMIVGVSCKA